jgi:acyl-coenzyme A synthetase/AMP-(fatty) acid ligase
MRLKELGAKKGDRHHDLPADDPRGGLRHAGLHRIGAVHSVVFGGFSPDSLANRIIDCDSNIVITADEGLRGGKPVPLKANTDEALKKCPMVKKVLVVSTPAARRLGRRPRRVVARDQGQGRRPTARPSRWAPRIRCSSSTPRARPESPRACCTPPAATSSSPR